MAGFGAQDQVYPATYAEDSLDTYLAQDGRVGRVIYLVMLGALVILAALLPLIRVHPSVRSTGVIRPAIEKHDVRARASGIVAAVHLRENAPVNQGDTLLVLRSESLDQRRALVQTQVGERRRYVHDLQRLTREPLPLASPEGFQTLAYAQEHARYASDVAEFTPRLQQRQRELERANALRKAEFVAQSEVDDRTYAMEEAMSERASMQARALADWQSRLTAYQLELVAMEAELLQIDEEASLYAVVAPVTGTVEQIASLSPGSFLQTADRLAVISPASNLLADVDVSPSDIGLLRVGMPARLRIDAFDATDWGFVTGTITEIPSDVVPVDGRPVFKVRVALEQEQLALRTGFVGQLKKGMTLQARFLLAERTLWQLLYDDVDDWLNPTRGVADHSSQRAGL